MYKKWIIREGKKYLISIEEETVMVRIGDFIKFNIVTIKKTRMLFGWKIIYKNKHKESTLTLSELAELSIEDCFK